MGMRPFRSSNSTSFDRTLFLVVPPQRGLLEGFSTGLVAIANYVRAHNPAIRIQFLDLGLQRQQELATIISNALLSVRGSVFVGITGTTACYQSMLAVARTFKAVSPHCIVVMGGHHVSPQDDIVLTRHSAYVDFVVRGEGEIALTRLVGDYPNVSQVPNISYLSKGQVIRTLDCPLLDEQQLDSLPPYFEHGGSRSAAGKFDHVTYVSARGCPLRCSFCAVRATAIRSKSVKSVISDIRHLVTRLGYSEIAIEDNFFAHSPKRTLDLCAALRELRNEVDFTWDCQTRVESMRRPEIVDAMAAAGCTASYLGVESLVPTQLEYLGKSLRPATYLESLERTVLPLMLKAGINPYLNLQLGMPQENALDHQTTVTTLRRFGSLAQRYGRKIVVFPQLNVIYPGTPHFDAAVADGAFGPLGREVFEFFTPWEDEHQPILHYLGEHFAHGVGGIPLGILDRDELARGRFQICPNALASVATQLRRMEVAGISIFRYGRYLVQETNECQQRESARSASA
jgi:hypothetical protein